MHSRSRLYLKDEIPPWNMEYSGGIFFKFSKYLGENINCISRFCFEKLIDAFDRKIGPDNENPVDFIEINIIDF